MTFVAFDIETTGLTANDTVTTIGTASEDGYNIYVNCSQGHPDVEELQEEYAGIDLSIYAMDNETELLEHLDEIRTVYELQLEGNMLVGFKSRDFDLPFLRTRCVLNDIGWPISGVNSIDLVTVYKYQWQTTALDPTGFNKRPLKGFAEHIGIDVDGDMYKREIADAVEEKGYDTDELLKFADEEDKDVPTKSVGTLDGIHDLLVGDDIPDPFESSEEAVDAFLDGNIDDVIRHNISDLKKTLDLVTLVKDYVPQGDLRVEKV